MYGLKVPLFDITFSDKTKLLVGCREQLRKKDKEFHLNVSHLMESMKSEKSYYCFKV